VFHFHSVLHLFRIELWSLWCSIPCCLVRALYFQLENDKEWVFRPEPFLFTFCYLQRRSVMDCRRSLTKASDSCFPLVALSSLLSSRPFSLWFKEAAILSSSKRVSACSRSCSTIQLFSQLHPVHVSLSFTHLLDCRSCFSSLSYWAFNWLYSVVMVSHARSMWKGNAYLVFTVFFISMLWATFEKRIPLWWCSGRHTDYIKPNRAEKKVRANNRNEKPASPLLKCDF
jgi:hypothetical protein